MSDPKKPNPDHEPLSPNDPGPEPPEPRAIRCGDPGTLIGVTPLMTVVKPEPRASDIIDEAREALRPEPYGFRCDDPGSLTDHPGHVLAE